LEGFSDAGGGLSGAMTRRDEKIVLIQDSCPNYAKMNHLDSEPPEDPSSPQKSLLPPPPTTTTGANQAPQGVNERKVRE
jgi:hypothetical protein